MEIINHKPSRKEFSSLSNSKFVKQPLVAFVWFVVNLLLSSCANPLITQIAQPKTVTFETNGGSKIDDQIVYLNYPIIRPTDPIKDNNNFDNWYSENENFETPWDFNTIPETDITLYANWTPNTKSIYITVAEIKDKLGNINFGNISLSRTGTGGNDVTRNILINITDYDSASVKWEIDGVGIYAGTTITVSNEAMFTINAQDIRYNSFGGHNLKLTVAIDTVLYQVNIPFTIVQ